MKPSTLVLGVCVAGAALLAAAMQPARTEGLHRSALDGMMATEMSLVRRELASVGELQSEGGNKGSTAIRAWIVRASSDRLVTSKFAYGVLLNVGGESVTLDVGHAQRLIETIDRVEAARAEPPGEPFESATVSYKDASGLWFTATADGQATVKLRDTTASFDSLRPLRDLLDQAVKKIGDIRKL